MSVPSILGVNYWISRSQWPCGLRRGSAAARLLGLWVRIPPGTRMSVSCECCQVEVSATSWSLVQRSPTECGVSKKCVIVKPRKMRRPRPPRGCRAIEKKNTELSVQMTFLPFHDNDFKQEAVHSVFTPWQNVQKITLNLMPDWILYC
jgi:hypothetical protein